LRDVLGVLGEVYFPLDATKPSLTKCEEFYARYPDASTWTEDPWSRAEPLLGWNLEFVQMDLASLFETILTANMLDLKPLVNLTSKAVAEMIKGKTPDEIKKVFGVEGDFTQEEKEQVLRDNPWLEDPGEADEAPEATAAEGGGGAAE